MVMVMFLVLSPAVAEFNTWLTIAVRSLLLFTVALNYWLAIGIFFLAIAVVFLLDIAEALLLAIAMLIAVAIVFRLNIVLAVRIIMTTVDLSMAVVLLLAVRVLIATIAFLRTIASTMSFAIAVIRAIIFL